MAFRCSSRETNTIMIGQYILTLMCMQVWLQELIKLSVNSLKKCRLFINFHMVGLSSYKILLICFCFISISSFFLHQKIEDQPSAAASISNSHPSLGFANYTGINATAAQVSSFINFINSASTYFRDDTKARLNYISDQMNKAYGRSGVGFSVVQQGDEAYFDWFIYSFSKSYASVAAGVDKVFPRQSYMFIVQPDFSERVFFSEVGQKGSGINSTFETVINNIILAVETSSTCECKGNSGSIADKLRDYEYGLWSVFCSNTSLSFSLNAYTNKARYIYTKPRQCYYGIYDSWMIRIPSIFITINCL